MILIASHILKRNVAAMALYPFIIIRDKANINNERLINHERIHLRQQIELLIIPFYILYLGEYLIRYIQYRNADSAYRNISFEREAYSHENNLNYLKTRRFFSFLRYM